MFRKGEKSMYAPMAEYEDYLNIVSQEDLEEQDSFCECGGYKLENLDVCEECL